MKYKECFISTQTLSTILRGFTTLQTSELFKIHQIKFVPIYYINITKDYN